MKIAHDEECQPPTASKICVALAEASRAEGDYIIVPFVTAQPEFCVCRNSGSLYAVEGHPGFGAEEPQQDLARLPVHGAETH